MNVYFEFARIAFRQKSVYRVNSYLYIINAVVSLFVQISVWYALYNTKTNVEGITLVDMTTFVLISSCISIFTSSSIGNKLASKIADGTIEGDFVRPVKLKYYLMFDALGGAFYSLLFTFVPVLIGAIIFVPVNPPVSLVSFCLFVLSVILGMVLAHYINYTLGLLAFWFKRSIYINWFLGAFFTLFGGREVPLWFYPEFLRKIALVLPFRFVSFEPVSIYLGKTDIMGSIQIVIFQLLWILAFMAIEAFVWKRAQEVVTIQGG